MVEDVPVVKKSGGEFSEPSNFQDLSGSDEEPGGTSEVEDAGKDAWLSEGVQYFRAHAEQFPGMANS